jgi:O-antigen/teichoic acid export membrane protein
MTATRVFHAFSSRIIGVLASVLTVVLTSRWMGAEWRGELSLFLTWAGAWMLLSDIMSGSVLINYSAKYNIQRLYKIGIQWVFLVVLLSALSVIFFAYDLPAYLQWYLIPMVLLMGFFNVNGALLIGKGYLVFRNYVFAGIAVLSLVLLLLTQYLKGDHFDFTVDVYVVLLLLAWAIMGVLLFIKQRKLVQQDKEDAGGPALSMKEMGIAGIQSQLGHVVQFALARGPFILLPYLFSKSKLGVFSNTVLLAESLLLLAASLGQVLHARMIHQENGEEAMATCFRFARISMGLTFFPLLVVMAIPEGFWEWLLQKEFGGMTRMLVFYAPVVLMQSVSTIFSHYFHAMGKFKILIWANGWGAAVAWVGMYFLGKTGGELGFIFGIVLGYVAQLVYLLVRVYSTYAVKFKWLIPNREDLTLIRMFFQKGRIKKEKQL